jgi:hypothetical protein
MSVFERVLSYGKSVVLLNERVEVLQEDMRAQMALTRDLDRRLVGLETFFGIAKQRFLEDL